METTTNTDNNERLVKDLVRGFGLVPHEPAFFIGKVHSFPVGLKFIGSREALLMLLQIRFPFDADANKPSVINYGAEIEKLIHEGALEVSLEDKIGWITVPNANPLFEQGSLARIIDSLLAALENAGLAGLADKCHYCQSEAVNELTCKDGKVAQICSGCLETKRKARSSELKISAGGSTKVIAWGLLASLVSSFGWMVIWIGHDAFWSYLNVRVIVVPRIVEILLLALVGAIVGGPVGYMIRQIPQRGDLFAGWSAIIFASIAVVFGEILFVTWLIYREFKVISFAAAIKVLPTYLKENVGLYLVEKIAIGAICVSMAYVIARPQRKGLGL